MKPSTWLYDFLKGYEKFRPTAYAATPDERRRGIWTLGYGHTKGVKEGDTCSYAQAQKWLESDTADAVADVERLVKVPLTQNQFDALVSLVFNCGASPLLMTLGAKLKARDYAAAADEFPKWNKQSKRVLPGLVTRRRDERERFLT